MEKPTYFEHLLERNWYVMHFVLRFISDTLLSKVVIVIIALAAIIVGTNFNYASQRTTKLLTFFHSDGSWWFKLRSMRKVNPKLKKLVLFTFAAVHNPVLDNKRYWPLRCWVKKTFEQVVLKWVNCNWPLMFLLLRNAYDPMQQ